jgi:hypothetical protein
VAFLCDIFLLVSASDNVDMQDPHLQKRLQQVLKLNKEKWEEARDHALKAVVVDNRMRVWWAVHPGGSTSRIGMYSALLYIE